MSDQTTTSGDTTDDQIPFRLTISPEPVGDEGEALIAAIAVYLSASPQDAGANEQPEVLSRWGAAGRRNGTRGLDSESRMGWGRRRAGWQ